jgi:hypothetical protein
MAVERSPTGPRPAATGVISAAVWKWATTAMRIACDTKGT